MNVNSAVKSLVHYAQKNNMIEKDDDMGNKQSVRSTRTRQF